VDLAASRRRASELSGGVSSEPIESLMPRVLDREKPSGSLLDVGAGTGELPARQHALATFDRLAGVDLFPRPATLPPEPYHDQSRIFRTVDGQQQEVKGVKLADLVRAGDSIDVPQRYFSAA
jgi:hypothetical protein